MTNEEKAKELVSGYGRCCKEECRLIALKMAEWKNQQFKEYLEKKRNEYIDTHKEGDLLLDYASCIDRIINEYSREIEEIDHSNNDE